MTDSTIATAVATVFLPTMKAPLSSACPDSYSAEERMFYLGSDHNGEYWYSKVHDLHHCRDWNGLLHSWTGEEHRDKSKTDDMKQAAKKLMEQAIGIFAIVDGISRYLRSHGIEVEWDDRAYYRTEDGSHLTATEIAPQLAPWLADVVRSHEAMSVRYMEVNKVY